MTKSKSASYKRVTINGISKLRSHRVWHEHTDQWPDYVNKREIIHHIDGDPLNNSFDNLLLMTNIEHGAYGGRRPSEEKKPLKAGSYKSISIDGVMKLNSHYIWFLNTGHWPEWPEVVHHIDGDKLNDDFKNLQLMTNSEHLSLHHSGKNHPMYSKTHSAETKQKMSEAKTGENHYRWLDNDAPANAKYLRHHKHPELYPPLTEEEKEEYRAYHRAYQREWRRRKKQ